MSNGWALNGNAISQGDFLGTTNSEPLSIRSADTERLRLDTNGNIQLTGNRTRLEWEGRRLDLRADGGDVDIQSDTSCLYIHTSGPGHNNVILNPFGGEGNVGIGTAGPAAKLHVLGNRTRLEWGGRQLDLRADGSDVDIQSQTSSVYIHSSGPGRNNVILNPFGGEGNVGIGTAAPAAKLEVAGDIRAHDVILTSDVRLKADIASVEGAMEKLQKIRGVHFTWLNGEDSDPGAHGSVGVVAQEVEAVFPELVDTRSSQGYKGVNYAGLIAVLIQAFNELHAENLALKHRIEAVERMTAHEE